MSSQSHVFTFEPETSVARVVCGHAKWDVRELTAVHLVLQKETVWTLWPAGTSQPVFIPLAALTSSRVQNGIRIPFDRHRRLTFDSCIWERCSRTNRH